MKNKPANQTLQDVANAVLTETFLAVRAIDKVTFYYKKLEKKEHRKLEQKKE